MKGISWSPQYDLNILSNDCQHIFQAFAEITNGTKQEYTIDQTELFGGDVCLEKEVGAKRRRDRSRSRSRSSSENSGSEEDEEFNSCNLTPTVDALGELAGKPHFCKCCILYFLKLIVPNRSLSLFNQSAICSLAKIDIWFAIHQCGNSNKQMFRSDTSIY